MENEKQYPSFPQQGENLAKFTFQIIKKALNQEALFVSPEVKAERLAICKECDWYDPTQNRCKHCGCFLDQKASFALDSCPIQKWDESDIDWTKNKFKEIMDQLEGDNNDGTNGTPNFPTDPKIGDVYTWEGNQWFWTGTMWDFDMP